MKWVFVATLSIISAFHCSQSRPNLQNEVLDVLTQEVREPLRRVNLVLKGFSLRPVQDLDLPRGEKRGRDLFQSLLSISLVDVEEPDAELKEVDLFEVVGKYERGLVVLYSRGVINPVRITAHQIIATLLHSQFQWSMRNHLIENTRLGQLSQGLTAFIHDAYPPLPIDFDPFSHKDQISPMYVGQNNFRESDVWGHPYRYRIIDQKVWVASSGSDGRFSGWDQSGGYSLEQMKGKDIIYCDGEVVFGVDFTQPRLD